MSEGTRLASTGVLSDVVHCRLLVLASVILLTGGGCGHADHVTRASTQTLRPKVRFVPATAALRSECRATATSVGYAVPCPTRVPELVLAGHNPMRLAATPTVLPAGVRPTRCNKLRIVGAGCGPWRGWVVGSSGFGYYDHLVIVASPVPLRNDAKVVNGPAWDPRARVRLLGSLTINEQRMRSIYVLPATNDGSAFMHHVVLIWTVGGHTYGIGFHDVRGIPRTLSLDPALARWVVLVPP